VIKKDGEIVDNDDKEQNFGVSMDTSLFIVSNVFNDNISIFRPAAVRDPIYEIEKKLFDAFDPIHREHDHNVLRMQIEYTAGNVDECERICLEDIKLAPIFREYYANVRKLHGQPLELLFPYYSFARLAIIYEKRKDYRSAIAICNKAIELGFLNDGTKGMEHRLSRLLRKLNQ
jgi:tetratricopeptide (TPR) repeat protein